MTLDELNDMIDERIGDPGALLDLVADRRYAHVLQRCSPGSSQPMQSGAPEDLAGLYNTGLDIYTELEGAGDAADVLTLLHPANVLPARTFDRMRTYTASAPTDGATVYGVPADSDAYGPDPNGNTAYGVPGGSSESMNDYIERQQAGNNKPDRIC